MNCAIGPSFKEHLAYYRSQHQTRGCRITHMIGIPMIFFSFPMFFFNPIRALRWQAIGWALQLWGHYGFEHNSPVFLEVKSPYTAMAALVFCYEEWAKTLKELAAPGGQVALFANPEEPLHRLDSSDASQIL
jgi:uncharacterized membrane protein YGL010W